MTRRRGVPAFWSSVSFLFVAMLPATIAADPMSELTVNSTFSDRMVLQRDFPIPVWGRGRAGESVTVELEGQKAATTVQPDGKWCVALEPMPAGGPHVLTVESGDRRTRFEDVLIGEVWLCSGQSNMQYVTANIENAEEAIADAENHPKIRLYLVPKNGTPEPLEEVEASWKVCNAGAVADFSAVAYLFARHLQDRSELGDVPIGLIDASYGGTMIEAWMSPETIEACCTDEKLLESMFGWKPGEMFNAMIAPIMPFSIRGILWYQGESNCSRPRQYERLLKRLIEERRAEWGRDNLPFLFVQLPNLTEKFDGWYFTWLREAQDCVRRATPETGMVVSIDTADGFDLHPRTKQPIADRLGLLARSMVYGEDVRAAGPEFVRMETDGKAVRLFFESTGGGLTNGRGEGPLRGFQIAGADGVFYFAQARIEGETVTASHPDVPKPVHVRYAWGGNPQADLYDAAGLPAFPFRTDSLSPTNMEIEKHPAPREFIADHYHAVVDGEGHLISLKIDGHEFLDASFPESRGAFFSTFWGPSRLFYMSEPGPNALFAENETASIRYAFFKESIELVVANKTELELPFIFVMNPSVQGSSTVDNQGATLSFNKTSAAMWHIDETGLAIEGYDRIHDDWGGQNRAVEITLKPNESRAVFLRMHPARIEK